MPFLCPPLLVVYHLYINIGSGATFGGHTNSGILLGHPDFSKADICALSIEKILDGYECVPQKAEDSFGHGTACAWIIHKKAPQAKIISIQALDNNCVGDFEKILFALEWCVSNKIDIINLSFGSTSKKHYKAFYDIGKKAALSNILIFAATHDYNLTSVPASVDNYIGVYRTSKVDKETYIWSEHFHRAGAYGRKQRVGWPLYPYYIMMEGSSLATAHMSGTGALIRELHPKENYEAYLNRLRDYAVNQETNVSNSADKVIINSNNASLFSIGKATIYGYTKEMHSLLKYRDLSNIEICEIVDHKRTTNIGKKSNMESDV